MKNEKHKHAIETPSTRPLMEFFGPEIHPPVSWEHDNEGSLSDYVLIDLDGRGENFRVGFYDFDDQEWRFNMEEEWGSVVTEMILWALLPLAKYEKK